MAEQSLKKKTTKWLPMDLKTETGFSYKDNSTKPTRSRQHFGSYAFAVDKTVKDARPRTRTRTPKTNDKIKNEEPKKEVIKPPPHSFAGVVENSTKKPMPKIQKKLAPKNEEFEQEYSDEEYSNEEYSKKTYNHVIDNLSGTPKKKSQQITTEFSTLPKFLKMDKDQISVTLYFEWYITTNINSAITAANQNSDWNAKRIIFGVKTEEINANVKLDHYAKLDHLGNKIGAKTLEEVLAKRPDGNSSKPSMMLKYLDNILNKYSAKDSPRPSYKGFYVDSVLIYKDDNDELSLYNIQLNVSRK